MKIVGGIGWGVHRRLLYRGSKGVLLERQQRWIRLRSKVGLKHGEMGIIIYFKLKWSKEVMAKERVCTKADVKPSDEIPSRLKK